MASDSDSEATEQVESSEIERVQSEIEDIEWDIQRVGQQIEQQEDMIKRETNEEVKSHLRKKEEYLRKEKEDLREEKRDLRKKEKQEREVKLPKSKRYKALSGKELKIEDASSQLNPSDATWDIMQQANILPDFVIVFLYKLSEIKSVVENPAAVEVPVDIINKAVQETASPTCEAFSRAVCLNLLAAVVKGLNEDGGKYKIVVEPIVYSSDGNHRRDKKSDLSI